jgi:putative hydrolase of HD superfamily
MASFVYPGAIMSTFAKRVLHLFEETHPLDRIARAGYVLRGVREPESVAAHSHAVALLTLLFCEEYPDDFDGRKALTMAIIHDLPEARIMDIPVPSAERYFKEAKNEAEQHIIAQLFAGFSDTYADLNAELIKGTTPEARLVRALDKAQMMLKIVMYEKEGQGRLKEFWDNPNNFRDLGLQPVSDLFDAICAERGITRPQDDA